MTDYYISLQGPQPQRKRVSFETVDEARNEAVRYLGAYLAEHPRFADEGHWRVNVEDEFGQSILHVIVATVTARNAA